MHIFPAIDLYEKKAVRLLKGDYNNMTVYSENPLEVAKYFEDCGAEFIHMVDLEGALHGTTPNFDIVAAIAAKTKLKVEIGGGIRSEEVIKKYLESGVMRVILGTAAVNDSQLLSKAAQLYGEKIAVGADMINGTIAIKGWTQSGDLDGIEFCTGLEKMGIGTVICTDISKDGAMQGTNRELYRVLSEKLNMNIVASGGVSSIEDVKALNEMNLYGAIIGKAIYTGAIDLKEAIGVTK